MTYLNITNFTCLERKKKIVILIIQVPYILEDLKIMT